MIYSNRRLYFPENNAEAGKSRKNNNKTHYNSLSSGCPRELRSILGERETTLGGILLPCSLDDMSSKKPHHRARERGAAAALYSVFVLQRLFRGVVTLAGWLVHNLYCQLFTATKFRKRPLVCESLALVAQYSLIYHEHKNDLFLTLK